MPALILIRRVIVVASVLVAIAACAETLPKPLPPTSPALTCDVGMIDHNRRACAERPGFMFWDPGPGSPSCGTCTTVTYYTPLTEAQLEKITSTETMAIPLLHLQPCSVTSAGITCWWTEEMPKEGTR